MPRPWWPIGVYVRRGIAVNHQQHRDHQYDKDRHDGGRHAQQERNREFGVERRHGATLQLRAQVF
jgi:hypothetical protein